MSTKYWDSPRGLLTDLLNFHEEMRVEVMKVLQKGGTYQEAAAAGQKVVSKYVEKIANEHFSETQTSKAPQGGPKGTAASKGGPGTKPVFKAQENAEVRRPDSGE